MRIIHTDFVAKVLAEQCLSALGCPDGMAGKCEKPAQTDCVGCWLEWAAKRAAPIPSTEAPVCFREAYIRMCDVIGVHTQTEIADFLGIKQPSVSDAKKRGAFPYSWLLRLLEVYGINPAWVKNGRAKKYLAAAGTPMSDRVGGEV